MCSHGRCMSVEDIQIPDIGCDFVVSLSIIIIIIIIIKNDSIFNVL